MTSKACRIYIPAWRQIVVRQDVIFEEEKDFRKSHELDKEEEQAPTPQDGTLQSSGSQVSRVTGYRFPRYCYPPSCT